MSDEKKTWAREAHREYRRREGDIFYTFPRDAHALLSDQEAAEIIGQVIEEARREQRCLAATYTAWEGSDDEERRRLIWETVIPELMRRRRRAAYTESKN